MCGQEGRLALCGDTWGVQGGHPPRSPLGRKRVRCGGAGARVCLCAHVCACIHTGVHVCTCMRVHVQMYVCAYACVHVLVCACVYLWSCPWDHVWEHVKLSDRRVWAQCCVSEPPGEKAGLGELRGRGFERVRGLHVRTSAPTGWGLSPQDSPGSRCGPAFPCGPRRSGAGTESRTRHGTNRPRDQPATQLSA